MKKEIKQSIGIVGIVLFVLLCMALPNSKARQWRAENKKIAEAQEDFAELEEERSSTATAYAETEIAYAQDVEKAWEADQVLIHAQLCIQCLALHSRYKLCDLTGDGTACEEAVAAEQDLEHAFFGSPRTLCYSPVDSFQTKPCVSEPFPFPDKDGIVE